MRPFCSLLIYLCLPFAFASSGIDKFNSLPAEMSYVSTMSDSSAILPVAHVTDLQNLVNVLIGSGLEGLNPEFGSGEAFMGVDDVYADEEFARGIFLKLDRRPQLDSQLRKIYILEGGFVYNGRSRSGLYFALYFLGFDSKVLRDFVREIQDRVELGSVARRNFLEGALLPYAEAGTGVKKHSSENTETLAPFKSVAFGTSRAEAQETFKITLEGVRECLSIFSKTKYTIIKDATWGRLGRVTRAALDFTGRSLRTVGNVFLGRVKFPNFQELWDNTKKLWAKVEPKAARASVHEYMAERLEAIRRTKKAPGERTRDNCQLFAAVGTKLQIFAAGFLLPDNNFRLAWSVLSHGSRFLWAKEKVKSWLEEKPKSPTGK